MSAIWRNHGWSSCFGAYDVVKSTAMNEPICISGAACCVRKRSAIVIAQNAAAAAIPITRTAAMASPATPGWWMPMIEAVTNRNVAGSSARSEADATRPSSRVRRGAGASISRSNQPCSMSRARFTPVAAPVNPAPWRKPTGTMNVRKLSTWPNPRWCAAAPKTLDRPSMKIVGASTPGIAPPGTRRISLNARRLSARTMRALSLMPRATASAGQGRTGRRRRA